MNYFKRALLVWGIFLILIFLLSLFYPSTVALEKTLTINNNTEVVQQQLEAFDLKTLHTYTLHDTIEWTVLPSTQGVSLSANLIIDIGFNPFSKFKAFLNREEVEQDFEFKIDSLKLFIEELPKIHSVKVLQQLNESMWVLSIRDTINAQEMSNIHGKLYAKINQYMDEHDIISDLAPIMTYHLWTDSIIDIEAGIPILDSIYTENMSLTLKKIPAGNVVTAIHYGPYERLPETYYGINEWMRKHKTVVIGAPWETYLTDPVKEENPNNWKTAISFPVE